MYEREKHFYKQRMEQYKYICVLSVTGKIALANSLLQYLHHLTGSWVVRKVETEIFPISQSRVMGCLLLLFMFLIGPQFGKFMPMPKNKQPVCCITDKVC